MAKKVKMDSSSLLKTLQVQSLLNTPEAEKIRMLDDEMKKIVNNVNLKTEEKVKKFEETLAQFKNIQNKIINQGGTSLLTAAADSELSVEKKIIDALKNVMEHINSPPAATTNAMDTSSDDDDDNGVINEDPLESQSTAIAVTPQRKSTQQPVQELEILSSPLPVVPKTPREQGIAAKTKLENFLQTEGLKINQKDGRIDVSVLKSGDNKKNTQFASSTYQKVLSFLTSPNVRSKKPHKADNLIKIIYKTMKEKNAGEFKKMLKTMPNLKNIDREYSKSDKPLIIPNWESI